MSNNNVKPNFNESAKVANFVQGIIPFDFENSPVRVLNDKTDKPWFVAKDVFAALGISWAGQRSLNKIKSDWQGVVNFSTPSGEQQTIIINQKAIWRLSFRSSKSVAEKFTDWVLDVVLPALQEKGAYTIGEENQPKYLDSQIIDVEAESIPEKPTQPRSLALTKPLNQAEYLKENDDLIYRNVKKFKGIMKEMAKFSDNQLTLAVNNMVAYSHQGLNLLRLSGMEQLIADSQESHHYTSGQIGLEIEKKIGGEWSAIRVNKLLEAQEFQYPVRNIKGHIDKWEPTEKAKDHGTFLDTGKRHKSTSQPITTWHWYLSILDLIDFSSVEVIETKSKPKASPVAPAPEATPLQTLPLTQESLFDGGQN